MRTTVNLDDALVSLASKLSAQTDQSALLHEGLKALIQRESAKRLAKLGGSESKLQMVSRRRPKG